MATNAYQQLVEKPIYQTTRSALPVITKVEPKIISVLNLPQQDNKTSTQAMTTGGMELTPVAVAKNIVQGVARSGASVGLTLASPFTGIESTENLDPEKKKRFEILFGKEPLKTLQTRIAENTASLESSGLGKASLPLSVLGVGAITGLDFTGAGAGKGKIAKKVLSETEKYVQEQVAKQTTARIAEKLGIVKKVGSFLKEVKTKLVDFASPIEDILASAQKKSKLTILPENHITNQIDRVLRTPTIAGQFARDNGLEQVIKSVDNLDNLDQYLIAKQAKTVVSKGIETGRDLAKDTQLIQDFAPRYEKTAKVVNQYSQKILDYSVDSGLISKELATKLKEMYPDYVPINRIFNEAEMSGGQFGSKSIASLSKQTVVQKLEGSKREIESPIKSLLEKTADVFKQGEKNKAGQMLASYEKLPGNPFEIVPLRTAENVKARIDIYTELSISKPIKNKLENLVSTRNTWARKLQSELNKLNNLGIKEYLKRPATEELPRVQGTLKTTTKTTIKKGTVFSDQEKFDVSYPETTQSIELKNTEISEKDVKDLVNSLISEPPEKIALIKKKIALRDKKLANTITDIQNLQGTLSEVKLKRAELFNEARLLKDAETRGKSTFSTFKDGIKEIYETTPEVADAAKALNVQQLNVLGKIFALPVRVAKVGITGINLPFIGANIVKDQISAIINSKNALKTSIANPVNFIKSLFEAVGHGKVYKEMARQGAMGTSFDIARNQVAPTIEKLRAGRTVGGKILYTVKHPSELLRAVENIVGRSEELTRIQQYSGTKQALTKKGISEADATIGASRAARENTVNFARRGEWGQVLNSAFLYLNAGIQGTRTFVRNFTTRPLQTATKMALVVFTPVAAATAWNLSDPKRKEAYDDIAEYEKQNNIIIIPPNPTKDKQGNWNVIKIPLSQEINNIAGLARRPIEQAYGLDPVSVKDIASALVGSVSPINPTTGSLASSLTPQAIKPTLEGIVNKNLFTGFQQVPQSLEKLSPELQVKPTTSGTVRKIGGVIKKSPIKIEEWIKGTFGGVGSQVLNASDHVLAGLDIIPKDQIGGQNVIKAIIARFATARGGQSDEKSNTQLEKIIQKQSDESFRLKQEAEILYTELKNLPKEEANNKADQIKEKNPKLYEKLKTVVETERKGLDYNDRLMLQLQVNNGERAKFIWESLKALKTKEEKNNYVEDLIKKGIISDNIMDQLRQLKEKGY